jgi:hypothetical protein
MLDAVRVSTGETQETVVHLCGSCGGGFSPMWPLGGRGDSSWLPHLQRTHPPI